MHLNSLVVQVNRLYVIEKDRRLSFYNTVICILYYTLNLNVEVVGRTVAK